MELDRIRDVERVYVFKAEQLAGTITRTRDGSLFEYDKHFLDQQEHENGLAVAYTLPLKQSPYQTFGDNLHPFFAGLLPEGRRLTALIRSLKTSADDMFTLLVASGLDCIGDISVSLDTTPAKETDRATVDLEDSAFLKLFEESISPSNYSQLSSETTIAGIQPKISAEMISFPLALQSNNKRYLLKLAPEEFPKLIENEHFFMTAAAECGIEVAKTAIVYDKFNIAGLLVERFDRRWDKQAKKIVQIHQEDTCQLLSRYPQDKYRVSLREVSESIDQFATSPIIEIANLLRISAFSYLIANGDMHAKNISLVQDPKDRRIVLSPAYDLLSTLPYGNQNMALELEGRKDKLSAKHFINLGLRFGVREVAIKKMLNSLCEAMLPFAQRVGEIGLSDKKTTFLQATIVKRIEQLRLKTL